MEARKTWETDDLEVFRTAKFEYYLPAGASPAITRPLLTASSPAAARTNGFDTTSPARVISTTGRFCSFMLSMPFSTCCMRAVYIPMWASQCPIHFKCTTDALQSTTMYYKVLHYMTLCRTSYQVAITDPWNGISHEGTLQMPSNPVGDMKAFACQSIACRLRPFP